MSLHRGIAIFFFSKPHPPNFDAPRIRGVTLMIRILEWKDWYRVGVSPGDTKVESVRLRMGRFEGCHCAVVALCSVGQPRTAVPTSLLPSTDYIILLGSNARSTTSSGCRRRNVSATWQFQHTG